MLNPDKSLALAVLVADEAARLGIKTALIGAVALAIHGYPRATIDFEAQKLGTGRV